MQQPVNYSNHLVRVKTLERERFGIIQQVDGTGMPFVDSKQFLFEVVDGQSRMPICMIEPENVLCDYGDIDEIVQRNADYLPWMRRVVRCGAENTITLFRAALIANGELVLDGAETALAARLESAQCQYGSDAGAWSDEAIQIAIQLSQNEEARSIKEIEARAALATLIADQMNSGNN